MATLHTQEDPQEIVTGTLISPDNIEHDLVPSQSFAVARELGFDDTQTPIDPDSLQQIFGAAIDFLKDDRTNTKAVINANCKATTSVLAQNKQLMDAYEKELARKDLTPSERERIVYRMKECVDSSVHIRESSQQFQREQQIQHRRTAFILLGTAFFLAVGGTAYYHSAT